MPLKDMDLSVFFYSTCPYLDFYFRSDKDATTMKVLIDCDPGIDDAIALGMLLTEKDVEVVGITCVRGNVDVDKTVTNTLRILEAFDRKDIPVFKGATSAIISESLLSFIHQRRSEIHCKIFGCERFL